MFKRILLPVDIVKNSNKSIEYTIQTAKNFNSEVLIIHAFAIPLPEYIPFNFDTKELEEQIFNDCNKIVAEVENRFKGADIKVKSFLKNGPAGFMIIRIVESEGCDLVIMQSRSKTDQKNFLIGSVSNYVIHHTKIPVLLIH